VTHALRSSEYHDRNAQYYRILQDMGLRRVEIYEFSRLNMVYTLLSKRKLLWFVQNKKVEDWTDPRFPTVQGIVRRGLKVEALIQFILQQVTLSACALCSYLLDVPDFISIFVC
jgi:glutamyl-tRNA synthetase